ncbi:MAG: Lrp/AsnC family transcriptional regulator [Gemmatimonadetes bacterium]|nr:Lrp/AsnC family transcriptional regulator [Gemmatimonadota bacterium]
MTATLLPADIGDEINARILAISEDRIAGFLENPFAEIARLSDVSEEVVHARIRAMLSAGTIRRVRQTLMATNLAPGALVAWRVPEEQLDAAFEYFVHDDPFSGHVVILSTDGATPGSSYRLWTTLKVPQGYSREKHCTVLAERVGASAFRVMPAKRLFALGVGHVRRKGMTPGSRSDEPGRVMDTNIVALSELEWRVLEPLKRELTIEEIGPEPWRVRAEEAGVPYVEFLQVGRGLADRGVIGRFSTFLEHVKPGADGVRVTRYNALFHWRVPAGREIEAGKEVGRHHILTHAYWREGGEEFANVNIMAVAHGTDKQLVLEHKAAIDVHLAEAGIPVSYTNVFWGGRSEIKPSEIAPGAYVAWCRSIGVDPASMRAAAPEEPGAA